MALHGRVVAQAHFQSFRQRQEQGANIRLGLRRSMARLLYEFPIRQVGESCVHDDPIPSKKWRDPRTARLFLFGGQVSLSAAAPTPISSLHHAFPTHLHGRRGEMLCDGSGLSSSRRLWALPLLRLFRLPFSTGAAG